MERYIEECCEWSRKGFSMEDNHLRDLFDSFMYAVSRTPRHAPIGTTDARKDIPKIHLKCRSVEEISHVMDFPKLYIDDDLLSDVPAIPPPTNQPWQIGCDFGYGDSKTVYVRLNEKHEHDGICVVPENEDVEETMKFLFGDIVVVEERLIGVIVKSWKSTKRGNYYEVYVRNYNKIKEYDEKDIERYRVRHKQLNEEEMYYQWG